MKEIEGYEDRYWITEDGVVIGRKGPMKAIRQSAGYRQVTLTRGSDEREFLIHRLVAIAYLPNPENKRYVNHKNGIKSDNRVENLEWATPIENTRHAWLHGLMEPARIATQGERNANAKLTADAVREIRERATNGEKVSALERRFGVTHTVILRIIRGTGWNHVV